MISIYPNTGASSTVSEVFAGILDTDFLYNIFANNLDFTISFYSCADPDIMTLYPTQKYPSVLVYKRYSMDRAGIDIHYNFDNETYPNNYDYLGGVLVDVINRYGSTDYWSNSKTSSLGIGALCFFAVTRKDGIWRTFANGQMTDQYYTPDETCLTITPKYLRIGCNEIYPYRYQYCGLVDDVTIIEGQALWTDSFYMPKGYILDEGVYEKTLDKSDDAKLYKPIQKNY